MGLNEFSYLWNEEKNSYVLVKTELGYVIINKLEKSVLLISDNKLNDQVIAEMIKCGNKIYNNLLEAYSDV